MNGIRRTILVGGVALAMGLSGCKKEVPENNLEEIVGEPIAVKLMGVNVNYAAKATVGVVIKPKYGRHRTIAISTYSEKACKVAAAIQAEIDDGDHEFIKIVETKKNVYDFKVKDYL